MRVRPTVSLVRVDPDHPEKIAAFAPPSGTEKFHYLNKLAILDLIQNQQKVRGLGGVGPPSGVHHFLQSLRELVDIPGGDGIGALVGRFGGRYLGFGEQLGGIIMISRRIRDRSCFAVAARFQGGCAGIMSFKSISNLAGRRDDDPR